MPQVGALRRRAVWESIVKRVEERIRAWVAILQTTPPKPTDSNCNEMGPQSTSITKMTV